ncbi:unnamed protein product [Cylicostephanus goldi]|uniref:ABC transporter domain-containing protein n=1 Tax=Cylicostephanus goldi TaxID=71465 RepID=A0A3P6Q728_CYLGO|nr:unnamed protein product [Cylicostephanus goldi]
MLYNELTAKEHLWFFYFMKRPRAIKLKGKWRTEAEVLIESLDMDSFKDRLVSQLSPCQKRKLNVALAFVGGSRIVFLDEPTIDMDQSAKECLYELVRQQKDCRTIMVSTQNMEDAEAMGQQLYVMYMGRTICSGDVNFIKSS